MDGAYLLGSLWREAVDGWSDARTALGRRRAGAADLARTAAMLRSAQGRLVVRSALRRRGTDRRDLPRYAPERARTPGALTGAEPEPGGGTVRFARAVLRVRVTAGGAVFCGWDGAEPEPSYALAAGCPPVDARAVLEPDGEGWRVVSERMTVRISARGAVAFHTPGGLLLRAEGPPRWRLPAGAVESRGGRWEQRARVPADARVYGLGGHGGGPALGTGTYRLWNSAAQAGGGPSAAMPVQLVVSDAGCHLVFHDSTWDGEVALWQGREGAGSGPDQPGGSRVSMEGGPVRYWVLAGTPTRVLSGWTALTGRPAVPPLWALGLHHALPPGAGGNEAVRAAAALREQGLPVAAVHLDTPGAGLEPAAAAEELAVQGVRLVSVVDPGVPAAPGTKPYEDGRAARAFVRDARGREVRGVTRAGEAVFPDVTDPAARTWWGARYAEEPLRAFAGFAHTMDEPQSLAAFGDPTLPRSARHALEGSGGDHREAHNVYGLQLARAAYEGLRAQRPEQRPFLLARSGWAGVQRYAGTTAGDTAAGWAGLRESLALVLGLGLSGVPLSGPVVGGAGTDDPELLARWFQLAAYLPLLRTGAAGPGPDGQVLEPMRAALAERARLLPYLETVAHISRRTGAPWVRPLWWKSPGDRDLRACGDAFLLGDALLVAPVLAPGVTRRRVRLPRGRWYDTVTGQAYPGRSTVLTAAPAERIPVLAKAGAVLPVAGPDGAVELEVWAPRAGRSGGGEVIAGDPEGWSSPRRERYVTRWVEGRVAVEREGGGAPRYTVRVRGADA